MKTLPSAIALAVTFLAGSYAQQSFFIGANVTGQLVISHSVNLLKLAQPSSSLSASAAGTVITSNELDLQNLLVRLRPHWSGSRLFSRGLTGNESAGTLGFDQFGFDQFPSLATPLMQTTPVGAASHVVGFNGLTHSDQRNANNGNQFSVEPPSPSIAVGNGFVLQGVNNAIMVYSSSGAQLLPKVLSSNEFFVLPPAIDRTSGTRGVFPTDMRVFYDASINRFLVTQWAQMRDTSGNLLDQSKQYIAVSQTGDPTANWSVYVMDTTNLPGESGCPCIPDYPQLGADQNGVYISSNEYSTSFGEFVHASILAISKTSLAANAPIPTLYRFILPATDSFEFAIQPATTPPGAGYFLASGGLEYFVSSSQSDNSHIAVWAMTNTASLGTANPSLTLIKITLSLETYTFPDVAVQRAGPLPYGSTLSPPGLLEVLDGSDPRVLSLTYSAACLYGTLQAAVVDESGRQQVGVAYFILSPTFRSGVLAATVVRQGYVLASNNNLLRPSIAVNAQGRGAIVFTLVGPDYFPSAAFVLIDTVSTGSTIQVSAPGAFPEDGFSGYPNAGFPEQGMARWGDYSTAVAASDGSIWTVAEYIANLPRTQLANWDTFIAQVQP